MVQQQALDLGGRDVEPVDDEQLLLAVDHREVPLGVQRAYVARAQPAVLDHLGRPARLAPVAAHHAVAALEDLSALTRGHRLAVVVHDLDLDAGHRPPGGGGDHLDGVAGPRHRHDRALHQAVGVDHAFQARLQQQPADQLGGHGGGAADRHADGVPGDVHLVQEAVEQRRSPGQHGDAPVVDELSQHGGGERLDRQEGGPAHHPGEQAGVQAEAVRERRDDRVAVTLPERDDLGPVPVAAHDLAVVQHHALRRARGARRGHDLAEVVRPYGERPLLGGVVGDPLPGGEHAGRTQHAGTAHPLGGDRVEQLGKPGEGPPGPGLGVLAVLPPPGLPGRPGGRGEEVGERGSAVEIVAHDQHAGARPAQHLGGLDALVAGGQRHDHRAGVPDAVRADRPVHVVGPPDGHPVAKLDAERDQPLGDHGRTGAQLGERQPHVTVDDHREAGVAGRLVAQHARYRPPARHGALAAWNHGPASRVREPASTPVQC